MFEHNVPKDGLETRASPSHEVTLDPLLPDQGIPVAGGRESCLRVTGSWLPPATVIGCVHCILLSNASVVRSVMGVVTGSAHVSVPAEEGS